MYVAACGCVCLSLYSLNILISLHSLTGLNSFTGFTSLTSASSGRLSSIFYLCSNLSMVPYPHLWWSCSVGCHPTSATSPKGRKWYDSYYWAVSCPIKWWQLIRISFGKEQRGLQICTIKLCRIEFSRFEFWVQKGAAWNVEHLCFSPSPFLSSEPCWLGTVALSAQMKTSELVAEWGSEPNHRFWWFMKDWIWKICKESILEGKF